MEAGLPASAPRVSDDEDDITMETGSGDTTLAPTLVHPGFIMEQAHYKATMADVQPAPAPMSVFKRALEQHRLAVVQIDGECMSEVAMVAMYMEKPNFVAEHRGLYEPSVLRSPLARKRPPRNRNCRRS
ncbi:hypothetical protein D1007_11741 [Hordeum vulgare]|nr:hypothetical protein D1007_11741 [Hordeum vulgare]